MLPGMSLADLHVHPLPWEITPPWEHLSQSRGQRQGSEAGDAGLRAQHLLGPGGPCGSRAAEPAWPMQPTELWERVGALEVLGPFWDSHSNEIGEKVSHQSLRQREVRASFEIGLMTTQATASLGTRARLCLPHLAPSSPFPKHFSVPGPHTVPSVLCGRQVLSDFA